MRKCQVKSTCTFCHWGLKMPPYTMSALTQIWCSNGERKLPRLGCAQNNCSDCKATRKNLEWSLLCSTKKGLDTVVTYHEWKSVDVPRQTKKRSDNPMTDTVKRQVHQSNTTTLGNLVQSYLDAVVALSLHIFVASWQWGQYRQTKQTMRPGTLVTVRDFAMNYLNIFQDEPLRLTGITSRPRYFLS